MIREKAPRASAAPRVMVLGVGTGACRALERMASEWTDGPALAAVDTSAQALAQCRVPVKLPIGEPVTRGLGAGEDARLGRSAAENDRDMLKGLLNDADLLILVAALGGGTGTGAAPVIARFARDEGILVLAFATLPFPFEGEHRRTQARQGLAALRDEADAVITIPNERLFELASAGAAEGAFMQADRIIGNGILGIWNLVVAKGLISVDFADLRAAVQRSGNGDTVFGYGEAEGPDRAQQAATLAMESPLLGRGQAVASAQSILVSIVGGPDLTLQEIHTVMDLIRGAAPRNVHLSMGAGVNPARPACVSVTIIASEQWDAAREEGAPAGKASGAGKPEETGARSRRRAGKPVQTKLGLDQSGRGRFKDIEPTIMDGEDLDIPTYARRGITILR